MIYEYTFGISMHHMHLLSPSFRKLIELTSLFSLEMTEDQFATFRADLMRDGIELHEISRRSVSPHEVVL